MPFNLMQANFTETQYEKTLDYTERVLRLPELEPNLKWDALLLKAKSALALRDSLTAADTYRQLENAPNPDRVAEALYFKSYQLYSTEKFAKSNMEIAKIAQLGGSSGIWNVKALILLAKNYNALDDPFQAIFVLESMIENFEDFQEEREEAKRLLALYNENLNKTPNATE